MGVYVSKADSSGSDIEGGKLFERVTDNGESDNQRTGCRPKHSRDTVDPKSDSPRNNSEEEQEVVEILCAADDEIEEEKEWRNICDRLKTDRSSDLHVANTKFQTTGISISVSSVDDSDPRNKFDEGEENKKVNFNRESSIMNREVQNNTLEVKNVISSQSQLLQVKPPVSPRGIITYQDLDSMDSDKLEVEEQIDNKKYSKVLVSAVDTRPQSPDSLPDDDFGPDGDPFEGMDIPRQRLKSFGSASIYSVKEISDDLFKEYFSKIKACLKGHGVFDRFPSPSVLSEAQRIYKRMDLPTPVDENGNTLPHPPKLTVEELFSSVEEKFEDVHRRVKDAPEHLSSGPMVDIAHYLCEGLDDEVTKIVSISSWLLRQHARCTTSAETPENLCRILHIMCKYSRIKTKLIRGIVRGSSYNPGDSFDKHHGMWVSVLINGAWCLVDPVLKIQQFQEKIADMNQPVTDLERHIKILSQPRHIFDDPEVFIFSHLPDEEHWQLLARPVTMEEYSELVLLRKGFFDLKMKVVNQPRSVVHVETDTARISLGWKDASLPRFMCQFYLHDKSPENNASLISNADLRRFVFLETNLNKRILNAFVKFPKIGCYMLEIYGSTEINKWHKISSFWLVYELAKSSRPFPVTSREEWGPGLDTLVLGLSPVTHYQGEITTETSVVQIKFKDRRGIQFHYELHKDGVKVDTEDIKLGFLRDKNRDVIFIVDMEAEVSGNFVMQLSARSDTSKPFQSFCNYLIRKERRQSLPKQVKEPTDMINKPTLYAPESGFLQMILECPGVSRLYVEFKLKSTQELNYCEHSRHWIEENNAIIELNFPRTGKYSLKVQAKCNYEKNMVTLRDEIIQANLPSSKWSPFPKLYETWQSTYRILSPLDHHVIEKEEMTFCVDVPDAQDIAVLTPNGWYHLEHEDDGLWRGQVWSGPKSTKCKLVARFVVGSGQYSDLLWFKNMADDDYNRLQERQDQLREKATAQGDS